MVFFNTGEALISLKKRDVVPEHNIKEIQQIGNAYHLIKSDVNFQCSNDASALYWDSVVLQVRSKQ